MCYIAVLSQLCYLLYIIVSLSLVLRSQHTPHAHNTFGNGNGTSHDHEPPSRDAEAPSHDHEVPQHDDATTTGPKQNEKQTVVDIEETNGAPLSDMPLRMASEESKCSLDSIACECKNSSSFTHSCSTKSCSSKSCSAKSCTCSDEVLCDCKHNACSSSNAFGSKPDEKSRTVPSESPSPRTKRSSRAFQRSSPEDKPTRSLEAVIEIPNLKRELDLLCESKFRYKADALSPETEHRAVSMASSLPSSPMQKKSKSGKKKKERKGSRTDSPKRKRHHSHGGKRRRGLSTSSSDDPKSSRSRTESGGSDVVDALDLLTRTSPLPALNIPQHQGVEVGLYEVQGAQNLEVQQSPDLNLSERTLVAEQDGETSKPADASRVLFDLQSLTSPTDTSSPKERKSKKKKKKSEKEDDGGSRRKSSKRKRGLSTSSSEDPKSSRSRNDSVGSETLGSAKSSKVQPLQGGTEEAREGFTFPVIRVNNGMPCSDEDIMTGSPHLTREVGAGEYTSPMPPMLAGSNRLECRVCITDCDEQDYSEC